MVKNTRKVQLDESIVLNYLTKDKAMGGVIAKTGEYEPYETKLILSVLQKGDIVLDIGAGIGIYALQFAKKVGLEGKVYAFEPEDKNFELLVKNAQENKFRNIVAFQIAVGHKDSIADLFVSPSNYSDHRLYPQPGKQRSKETTILDNLDNLLFNELKEKKKVKVLKIDTKGYEPYVIEGAQKVIEKDRPNIFMEYWPYGYKRAGADYRQMIQFLLKIYGAIYVIDEKEKRLRKVDEELLNKGCNEEKISYSCDIAFLTSMIL